MSSDYYFNKWKKTLASLLSVTELDLEFQEIEVHDQKRCDASQRLSGILGTYISCYNDALECLQQNLQVQKTVYIADVVKAIVARILELKEQLRNLEGAYFQFLSNGLIEHKLTPNDAELSDISAKYERSEEITDAVRKAFQKAKEIKEKKEDLVDKEEENLAFENLDINKWWQDTIKIEKKTPKKLDMTKVYEIEEKISDETSMRKIKVAMIKAHEKTRQVTLTVTRQKQRREMWAKELQGTLNPTARIEIRERGAKLIQKCLRFYFELKRLKFKNCKRDELLQLRLCNKPSYTETRRDKEIKSAQFKLYKQYEEQRKVYSEEFKKRYAERRVLKEDVAEDTRDNIRDWFQKWYNEARFFYDIPKEKQGGSALILKEEVPTPVKWKDKYEAYLEIEKANKSKTALQVKFEKLAAKEEKIILKREETKKKTLEAELLKKMMKNPILHPGYKYPASKKTEPLIQAIKKYQQDWLELDKDASITVKEKFVKNIDEEHIFMEVKLEVNKIADMHMREELKQLKRALKNDYKRTGEEIPEPLKEKAKRKKKQKRKIHVLINKNTYDKLTDLAVSDVLKEYTRKYFTDFIGDANFAGDNIRCMLRPALHFGAETRAIWWENCREVIHGFKRILLVGPRGCGKTTLVHIMATVNDAVLYELDPTHVIVEYQTPDHLQRLIDSVAMCARATQPSVIYIKDVHRFYYSKVPPKEMNENLDIIKRFFIRKLFKKIHHYDNVTIVGTCTDPWLTKSKQMLRKFPTVLLLPDTSYSAVYLILRNWVLNNRIIPPDLDIHSLARVLQGYSFGYLVNVLDDFLSADRIVKISAHGLTPQTIHEYILSNENETKVDYQRYLKWYAEKTRWGKIESKQLQEDEEFRNLVEEWTAKLQRKKQGQKYINFLSTYV